MNFYTDVFIIGGGINGAAIAADAAGRGLSVTLCEQGDLASGTSSASSKLIHGGLRYLEHYEFSLVRHALLEREIALKRAPHLVRPLQFILPQTTTSRPAWLIRLGLFLYDHLTTGCSLPRSHSISFNDSPHGKPLALTFKKGFSYYDCLTDDSRLVIENALLAAHHGASILPHTRFISAHRDNNHWVIQCENISSKKIERHEAHVLVNAAGAFVKEVHADIKDSKTTFDIALSQGSHVIVPAVHKGDFAYVLQGTDNRVIFMIPWCTDFTLIGTTDKKTSNPASPLMSDTEEIYLLEQVNHYLKKPLLKKDILFSFSGVRCLQLSDEKNLSAITRDYQLLADKKNRLFTVIGGKLTTHRLLAEQLVSQWKSIFPTMGPAWTACAPFPGGDFQNEISLLEKIKIHYPWLPKSLVTRYTKHYGARLFILLKDVAQLSDLGYAFSPDFYEKEVDFLIQHEWACTAEDILWRRTKEGLVISSENKEKLEMYMR